MCESLNKIVHEMNMRKITSKLTYYFIHNVLLCMYKEIMILNIIIKYLKIFFTSVQFIYSNWLKAFFLNHLTQNRGLPYNPRHLVFGHKLPLPDT